MGAQLHKSGRRTETYSQFYCELNNSSFHNAALIGSGEPPSRRQRRGNNAAGSWIIPFDSRPGRNGRPGSVTQWWCLSGQIAPPIDLLSSPCFSREFVLRHAIPGAFLVRKIRCRGLFSSIFRMIHDNSLIRQKHHRNCCSGIVTRDVVFPHKWSNVIASIFRKLHFITNTPN